MNALKNQEKGFTIIEVVLVLAIAGLIFLMIFIAWPALQKNQRDTAKRNDAAVAATALGVWKSNHRGQIVDSGDFNDFKNDYIENLSQYDVQGNSDLVFKDTVPADGTIPVGGTDGIDFNNLWYYHEAKCDEQDSTKLQGGTSRQAAIVVLLESGSSTGIPYCQQA